MRLSLAYIAFVVAIWAVIMSCEFLPTKWQAAGVGVFAGVLLMNIAMWARRPR